MSKYIEVNSFNSYCINFILNTSLSLASSAFSRLTGPPVSTVTLQDVYQPTTTLSAPNEDFYMCDETNFVLLSPQIKCEASIDLDALLSMPSTPGYHHSDSLLTDEQASQFLENTTVQNVFPGVKSYSTELPSDAGQIGVLYVIGVDRSHGGNSLKLQCMAPLRGKKKLSKRSLYLCVNPMTKGCGLVTKASSDMTNHQECLGHVPTELQPECSHCKQRFPRRSSLERHRMACGRQRNAQKKKKKTISAAKLKDKKKGSKAV